MPNEEIGKHKGAVETLLHEKKELSRLLQIVNSQLQRHLSALEEQGIDAERFIEQVQQESPQQQKSGKQSTSGNTGSRGTSSSGGSSRRSRDSGRSRSGRSGRKKEGSDEDSDERDFNPL